MIVSVFKGYHGYGDRESEMMTQTIEALRREVELCDCYCGAVMVHSLSGGTGSGICMFEYNWHAF